MLRWLKKYVHRQLNPVILDPTELFPGVVRPSITLAHMCVAEMLRNLDIKEVEDITKNRKKPDVSHRDDTLRYYYVTRFPKFTVYREFVMSSLDDTQYLRVMIGVKTLPFGPDEDKILYNGFSEWQRLKKAHEARSLEEKQQQLAVDLIAEFMGVAEESGENKGEIECQVS